MWKIWLWTKEAISGLIKNFTSSFFAGLLTFAAVFIFSMWMIIGANIDEVSRTVKDSMQISMNLNDDVQDYKALEKKILSLDEVSEAFLITKEEAFERMKVDLGERSGMLTTLEFNPFPASFEIKVKDADDIKKVSAKLETWEESKSVKYGEGYVEELMMFTKNVSKGVYVIISLIMFFSGLTIFFSIRLSIENRHRELAIKNLVGAGPFNIRIPFILEGIVITGTAAAFVVLLIFFSYDTLVEKITRAYPGTALLPLSALKEDIIYKSFMASIIIGFLSSLFSTHKHIKST